MQGPGGDGEIPGNETKLQTGRGNNQLIVLAHVIPTPCPSIERPSWPGLETNALGGKRSGRAGNRNGVKGCGGNEPRHSLAVNNSEGYDYSVKLTRTRWDVE